MIKKGTLSMRWMIEKGTSLEAPQTFDNTEELYTVIVYSVWLQCQLVKCMYTSCPEDKFLTQESGTSARVTKENGLSHQEKGPFL